MVCYFAFKNKKSMLHCIPFHWLRGMFSTFFPTQFICKAYNPNINKKSMLHCIPFHWLRGKDSNLRPSGYEPDELPTAPPRDIKQGYYISKKQVCQYKFLFFIFLLPNIFDLNIKFIFT